MNVVFNNSRRSVSQANEWVPQSLHSSTIDRFFAAGVAALSCYQCSMKYSNAECNANNSTAATECQPTFDTCVTIVLKPGRRECVHDRRRIQRSVALFPAILDQLLITKFCTKRKACEQQRTYTETLTPCRPNDEGRSWGCVTCCGDRDMCNHDDSNRLRTNYTMIFLLLISSCTSPLLSLSWVCCRKSMSKTQWYLPKDWCHAFCSCFSGIIFISCWLLNSFASIYYPSRSTVPNSV